MDYGTPQDLINAHRQTEEEEDEDEDEEDGEEDREKERERESRQSVGERLADDTPFRAFNT